MPSTIRFRGDGVRKDFTLPCTSAAAVTGTVSGVTASVTLINNNTARFAVAPAAGTAITITFTDLAVSSVPAAGGITPEQLDQLVTDPELAAALTEKKGRVYRYVASEIPATGFKPMRYFAGAEQDYDSLKDVKSDALIPFVYAEAYDPYMGLFSLSFSTTFDGGMTRTSFCRNETSIGNVSATAYTDTSINPLAAGQAIAFADGTYEAMSFTLGGTFASAGYALVETALKAGTASRTLSQFYSFVPLAVHRVTPGELRIYVACNVAFTNGESLNGLLFFAMQTDGTITKAKFVVDVYYGECPGGIQPIGNSMVLTDFWSSACIVDAAGYPTKIAISSSLSYMSFFPTLLGNKVYSLTGNELHVADITLTHTNGALSNIAITGDTKLFTSVDPIVPCRRGTKMFLLGRKATYVLDNTNQAPRVHQLTHPLLSSETHIVYPACVYRQNQVDVVLAFQVKKTPNTPPATGYPLVSTGVIYDFDAAADACLVNVIKE